jgi:isocitrate dehydrogenase (NAD+)
MMLDWLGEKEMAKKIEDAVAMVVLEGKARTYDMGGSTTTTGMTDAICDKIKEM